MKLSVENIAKIGHAEVMIDGISVLAGYNATGKSTISKSLNAIILAYTDILKKAENSQIRSMSTAFNNFLGEVFRDDIFFPFFTHSSFIRSILLKKVCMPKDYAQFRSQAPSFQLNIDDELPEATDELEGLYQKFLAQFQNAQNRSQEEYIQFEVGKSILQSFDSQINTLGQDSIGKIVLSDDKDVVICEVSFKNNRIQACSYKSITESNPIYLEPKHTLDGLPVNSDIGNLPYRRTKEPILKHLLARDVDQTETTIELQEKSDKVITLINGAIHGGLVENGNSLQYMDENAYFISLKNLASGNKTFATIKRLVENGEFYKNQTLIIDEPEVNLHPEWQLILANVLVILYKEMGLKVFLNSHSPYFIRAVEACSKRYAIEGHCFFYRTIQGENGLYQVEDVTHETEKIYRTLYRPLEEL